MKFALALIKESGSTFESRLFAFDLDSLDFVLILALQTHLNFVSQA